MLQPHTLARCPSLRLCLFLKLMLEENEWAQVTFDLLYMLARYVVIGLAAAVLAIGCALLSVLAVISRFLCLVIAVPCTPCAATRELPRSPRRNSRRLSPRRNRTRERSEKTVAPVTDPDVTKRPSTQESESARPQSGPHRVTFVDNPSNSARSPSTSPGLGLGVDTRSGQQPQQQQPVPPLHLNGKALNLKALPILETPPISPSEDSSIPSDAPDSDPTRESTGEGGAKSRSRSRCLPKTPSKKPSKDASPPPPPRTNPYQAPYFFPTPRSPDAVDYIRRVRMERRTPSMPLSVGPEVVALRNDKSSSPLPSPLHQTTLLPDVAFVSSPPSSPPKSPTEEPQSHIPDNVNPNLIEIPAEATATTQRRRRSWHINFKHGSAGNQPRQSIGSWESEMSPSTSSHPGPSRNPAPVKKPSLKKIFRRSGSHAPPLPETVQDNLSRLPTSTKEPHKSRSWHGLFHHRRASSLGNSASHPVREPPVHRSSDPSMSSRLR